MKKIVFIKMGSFSHTNDSVRKVLTTIYPDNEVIEIDIWNDIINIKSISNILFSLFEYGPSIFLSKKAILFALIHNTYIFKLVKNRIKQKIISDIGLENILFTFQTQSLFDSSLKNIPHYIYTDHTFLVNETYPYYNKDKRFYNNKWLNLEKSIYKNATINFSMSTHVTKSIIKNYECLESKVKCVYAGSNIESKNIVLSTDRYKSKNILFVGVEWERKGGPILEKAFKNVLKKHPDATLTIVGCSPNISLHNCNIIGKVQKEQVGKYYNEAAIFCLPTNLEPFGIVFLEAMNYKLPIVATNIGAIPDFIEESKNGYMVNTGNIDELSNKLIDLLNSHSKCKTFGEYGYNNILCKYNWKNVGQSMKNEIEKSLF